MLNATADTTDPTTDTATAPGIVPPSAPYVPYMPEQGTEEPNAQARSHGPLTRRELLLIMLLSAVAVTCFLSSTIFTGRFLSPADMLFGNAPWATAKTPPNWAGVPGNWLLSDSTQVFEPWRVYTARRLHEGSIPLWNPDNMLGAPFVGNSQSAVFYPLNWLYYLLPSGYIFLFSTWLKLFLTCIGTYLFARQALKVGPLPSVVAMLTYSFGAFMSVWLVYPLSDVTMWLPWTMWATSRLMQKPSPRRIAILAVVAGMSLLAGHAETQFHVGLATGIFALFEVFRAGPLQSRRIISSLAMWGVGYGLGFCLAAIELLPFVEYLNHSAMLAIRSNSTDMEYQPFFYGWTLFSPRLFGTPQAFNPSSWWGPGNYNETNAYCGVLAILLSPFVIFLRNRSQRLLALFVLALALVCIDIIYKGPVLYDLASKVPFLRLLRNGRLVFVVEFAIAMLGALGLEAIVCSMRKERWKILLCLVGSVAAVLGIGALYPWQNAYSPFPVPPDNQQIIGIWKTELLRGVLVVVVCTAILFLAATLWSRRPKQAHAALVLLPLVLMLDLWQAHGTYTPSIAPDYYYPPTQETTFLQQNMGLSRLVAQGGTLAPNINLVYGLADLRGYDAVMPLSYMELGSQIDGGIGVPGPRSMDKIQSPLLNLLNVRYLLVPPGNTWDLTVVDAAQEEHPTGTEGVVGPISGDTRPGQTFKAQSNNLTAIKVFGATYARANTGHIIFHLKTSPEAATDIATLEQDADKLADNGYWQFDFPPIVDSAGKSYYFYLESPDSPTNLAVTVFYTKEDKYTGGTRMANGQPADGDLAFQAVRALTVDDPWMQPVQDSKNGHVAILENMQAQPRAWLTHRAEVQEDKVTRLMSLRDTNFDYAGTVMLNAPLPANESLPTSPPVDDNVTITHYEGERVQISTHSTAPGVLVLADQDFPGWQAYVDGKEVPIITADHALRGVYLAQGDHTVSFQYEPVPYKIGMALGIGGTAVIALLALFPVLPSRFKRRMRRMRLR